MFKVSKEAEAYSKKKKTKHQNIYLQKARTFLLIKNIWIADLRQTTWARLLELFNQSR